MISRRKLMSMLPLSLFGAALKPSAGVSSMPSVSSVDLSEKIDMAIRKRLASDFLAQRRQVALCAQGDESRRQLFAVLDAPIAPAFRDPPQLPQTALQATRELKRIISGDYEEYT